MPAPLIHVSRNPLAYPCGVAPGFDPKHPMSDRIRFSGFCSGGNFVEILSGGVGAPTGAPTPSINSHVGPAVLFPNSTNRTDFTGRSTINDASVTIAAIMNLLNDGAAKIFFSSSSANTGWRTAFVGLTTICTSGVLGDIGAAITVPAAGPIFFAMSASSAGSVMAIRNLSNGRLLTASGIGRASGAPNGTYCVGGHAAFANVQMLNPISLVMFAAQYHALQELVAWSSDPWSFWYPQPRSYRVGISSIASGGWGPLIAQKRSRFIGSGMVLS